MEILAEMVTFDGPIFHCPYAEIRDHIPQRVSIRRDVFLKRSRLLNHFISPPPLALFFAEHHANTSWCRRVFHTREDIALLIELTAAHHDSAHGLHDGVEFHEILAEENVSTSSVLLLAAKGYSSSTPPPLLLLALRLQSTTSCARDEGYGKRSFTVRFDEAISIIEVSYCLFIKHTTGAPRSDMWC